MIKTIRKTVSIVWIFTIIILAFYVAQHKEYLDPQNLLIFFQSFGSAALVIFILASFIRGIVLLPSLPLVLVGILFFPSSPNFVFFISMLGIVFSGILIYKFSDVMGFDEMFADNVHNAKIKLAIEKYGFIAVMIWSFVPLVPTDLICYVAGIVKMNFYKFILALFAGEAFIVGIIVYGGKELITIIGL